jgi:hypothetical protein
MVPLGSKMMSSKAFQKVIKIIIFCNFLKVSKGCPQLTVINIKEARLVSSEGVRHIAANCHSLVRLDMNTNTQLTGNTKLIYGNIWVDSAFKYLAEGCPDLRELYCEKSGISPL